MVGSVCVALYSHTLLRERSSSDRGPRPRLRLVEVDGFPRLAREALGHVLVGEHAMVPGEARPAVDEMVALLPPTERARVPVLDREQQKQGLGIIPEPGQLGYGSLVLYKELVKGGTLPGVQS